MSDTYCVGKGEPHVICQIVSFENEIKHKLFALFTATSTPSHPPPAPPPPPDKFFFDNKPQGPGVFQLLRIYGQRGGGLI
jgi:hypothetical protein